MTKTLSICSTRRDELIDITARVAEVVAEARVVDGWCVVYCPHTTAGVTINEGCDPDVATDLLAALDRMVPQAAGYRHAEGNSTAHVKASLLGASQTLLIVQGALGLGRWQAVWFGEFDGPRSRQVVVRVMETNG